MVQFLLVFLLLQFKVQLILAQGPTSPYNRYMKSSGRYISRNKYTTKKRRIDIFPLFLCLVCHQQKKLQNELIEANDHFDIMYSVLYTIHIFILRIISALLWASRSCYSNVESAPTVLLRIPGFGIEGSGFDSHWDGKHSYKKT